MGRVDSSVRLSLLSLRGSAEPPRQPSRFVADRVLILRPTHLLNETEARKADGFPGFRVSGDRSLTVALFEAYAIDDGRH